MLCNKSDFIKLNIHTNDLGRPNLAWDSFIVVLASQYKMDLIDYQAHALFTVNCQVSSAGH